MSDSKQKAIVREQDEQIQITDLADLGDVFQKAMAPFAKSQAIVAQEATKQTTILAKESTKRFYVVSGLVLAIIVLAGFALYLGKDAITEKVIIATVSFITLPHLVGSVESFLR